MDGAPITGHAKVTKINYLYTISGVNNLEKIKGQTDWACPFQMNEYYFMIPCSTKIFFKA